MSSESATTRSSQSLVTLPSNPVAYVAVLAALVTAAIHLLLAPRVMGFDRTTGILFYLNGLGFIGGIVVFLSRFWRRELYLVAAAYALATVAAFFLMDGPVNTMSIAAKAAEAALAGVAAYLYVSDSSD